jgi:iron complex outermembrane receptor protein
MAKSHLKSLARGASLVAALAAAGAASPAFAQEAAEEEEAIVVTGTRLRGAAPVGSALQSITSEDLEDITETSTARIVQTLPQVFDLGISEGSRGQNGGNGNIVYGTGINLRGLGPYSTLVLVDGHRAVNNNRALDPSVLPALGLQRIEVLSDGASAIYGSDAVAGVVNLVPVRFQDGGQIHARVGYGDNYDEHSVGLAWGDAWESGQVHIAYENARRSALSGRHRAFFRQDQTGSGGLDYRISQCDPGNIVIGGVSYAIPQGGVTPANNSALVAGTQNLCEGSLNQDLLPEQSYDSFAFTFNQDIAPAIEFIADGFYSERRFYRAVAYTAANLTVPSTNAFFTAPAGLTPASETIRYNFEDDLPSNDTQGFARNYEATAGLSFKLPGDWRFETLVTYGEGRDYSESRHGLDNAALNAALASTNPATAFDPYGLHRTSPQVLAQLADQIFLAPTNNEFLGFEARIDGALFEIPGGAVRLAAGYERQDLDYHVGLGRGQPTTPITFRDFERQVDAAYAEALIPIFGESNSAPGFQRLDINVAARYDNYSDVGSTTNPKIGVNWVPVEDLLIRGSYGTSLRAPSFAELYGNSNNLFTQNYTDPTLPGIRQGVALSGGNADLKPEEATTWTVGVEYAPAALPGARFTATYFDIEYEGQIASYLSNLNILSLESEFAGTGIITRGADAATRVADLLASGIVYATPPAGSPITLFVDGRTFNLGRSLMRGFDFEASYVWDIGAGELTAALNGAWMTNFESSITPSGTLVDRLDTIFNPHDFRMRTTLAWDQGPFRAFVAVNYIGEYDNDLLASVQRVDAWTTIDANLTMDFGDADGFTIGLDARNLFDEDPPYVNVAPNGNGSGGYDASAANPTGRVLGVSLRKRF